MKSVCYHGGAHPSLEPYIIKHRGKLPSVNNFDKISTYERQIVKDLENADYIIAEGHWSKETIIHSGIHKDKVFEVIIKSAIFEFLYKPKTSSKIIINEYLRASNFFIEDGQTKYLNALLDKISKKIRNSNG